jgi:hypothetical protein
MKILFVVSIFIFIQINGQNGFLPLPHDAEIIFHVDMNNAKDRAGITFESIENVVFNCPSYIFSSSDTSWYDSLNNYCCYMYDDGTNGDEIANNNIWSIIIYFPLYSPQIHKYKYSANYNLSLNGGRNNNESDDSLYHYIELPEIEHGIEILYGIVFDTFGTMKFQDVISGIENLKDEIVSEYLLSQNYPNPFNPSTLIKYSIPRSIRRGEHSVSQTTLKIYDILGNKIATLVNEQQKTGFYEVKFDAQNLSSGIYFYRLQSGNFCSKQKNDFS